MSLVPELVRQINNPAFPREQRVLLRCALAKELEDAGNYEAAREAMADVWQRIGERPTIEGLDTRTAAEVLMRAGALTGWIGSSNQLAEAQEQAKDLLSESIELFRSVEDEAKIAEAQTEIAYCYWREGAFDEARITLRDALSHAGTNADLRAVALLRSAIVEISAQRFNDALRFFADIEPLVGQISNHSFLGRFHVGLANTLKNLGTAERRGDYIDRALIEYSAASHHFEQAGHTSYRAAVENNLGFLLFKAGKLAEASEHLDRARRLFSTLKDKVHGAQVDETRARVLLAKNNVVEAEKLVRSAVLTLEKGGEQALLAEALTTHGVALSRSGEPEQAQRALQRAIEVAEQAGDLEGAGRAVLSLIEEQRERLSERDAREAYKHADELLRNSQHDETIARLRNCARLLIESEREGATTEQPTKFVYADEKTAAVLQQARRLAMIDRPVLISGESGTGKELLARLLHEWSGRGGRFVTFDCATVDESTSEAELFGQRLGSVADGAQESMGAVREAAGGTLLLDGVAQLSIQNQIKVLRLIERGEIHPTGAATPERVNVRVIATTNRDLADEVTRGRFRHDLYYRLQTFELQLPPLRERADDIPAIAEHFRAEACERHRKRVTFHPDSLVALRQLALPGNARELRILIDRTLLKAHDGMEIPSDAIETVALRQTQKAGFAEVWEGCSLVEEIMSYEKGLILRALNATEGGVTRAARLLGVTHQNLSFILNTRHKDLLSVRKPVMKRRRSIIRPDVARDKKRS